MRLVETPIVGAFVVEAESVEDERGFFARLWDADEFRAAGLNGDAVEASVSFNLRAGTVRGLHWQQAPHAETKIVRCTRGAIFDVIADVRADSPSYHRWFGIELSENVLRMLYAPEGVAHGFQTLRDNTEVQYQISEHYAAGAATGCRFDDPVLEVAWPREPTVVSERDLAWPPLVDGLVPNS